MAETDMHNIAKLVTRETCRMLQDLLPTIGGADWWKTCVVAKLSYQQQERVERSKINSLDKLVTKRGLSMIVDIVPAGGAKI